MTRRRAGLAPAVALLAGTASAQIPCPPGSPPGYVATPTAPAFVSIVGDPAAVLVHPAGVDDLLSAAFPLAIPFTFMGAAKTTFRVDSNGWLSFGAVGSDFTNDSIPSATTPNDLVAPWWDDLHTGPSGSVLYALTTAGDLVVEWNNVQHYPNNGSGENATFQLVLHPSPLDTIEFRYDGTTFTSGTDPWNASVGVENATGVTGLDVTGGGAANALFPASDFLLDLCSVCGVTTNFGVPCPAAIAPSGGAPVAGNASFAVTQTGAPPSAPAFLVLGLSNTVWTIPPAVPLPLPLTAFGFAGSCSLAVSPEVVIPASTTPAGTSAVPAPVPLGTPACGAAYLQWINVVGIAPITLSASNGLTVVTG